jgi:hypothetical protein
MNPLAQIKRENWPELIDDLAEIIGEDAALKMFIRFAGRHLSVPRTIIVPPAMITIIKETIGEEKAELLVKNYGGEYLKFPNGRLILNNDRDNRIVEDYLSGMRQGDIATKYELSERRINTIINNHKDTNVKKS